MKNVFEYVICFLILIAYNYICLTADAYVEEKESTVFSPAIVRIGGFFHEEEISQARLVFEYAFFRFRLMESGLNFEPNVKIISPDDSFESSQLMCEMSKEGLAGVIGPVSYKTAPVVESICLNLEIPIMQISWRPTASTNSYTDPCTLINLFPEPGLLFKGIGVIAKHLQWKSFVILYQNPESLIKIQHILKFQSFDPEAKQNDIFIKELGDGPNYMPVLKEVRDLNERRIVLECDAENILPLLEQAKSLNLLASYYQYFITSLDAHTVNLTSLNIKANITTIRIIDPVGENFNRTLSDWQHHKETFKYAMDLDRYSIKTETALMHDALILFMTSAKQLHLLEPIEMENLECFGENKQWSHGVRIASFMQVKTTNQFGITGPIEFDSFGRRKNFTIYFVDGNRNDVQGLWTPSLDENLVFLQSDEDRQSAKLREIEKDVLIVSSRIQAPYLRKKMTGTGEGLNDRYEGFSLDLMNELAKELVKHNFDLKFKFEAPDNMGYGKYVEENKTWDGIVGEILADRAQLGICDLTITHQRREVVDFSTPFMRLGVAILHKTSEEKNVSMFAFLDPFSMDLWIYTATLYLIMTVITYFIARMSPPDWENPHPCDQNPEELENIWDLMNCLWLTMGSLMNQGCDILPKGMSSRMVTAMWWFFIIIVTNSYMANLTAFLTVANMESALQSPEDLVKQTKVKYGVLKGGATEAFFRDSKYPIYQKMWAAMEQAKPTVFEDTNEDGVSRVKNTKYGRYAYLMESTTLEYTLYTECTLRRVGDILDGTSKGYGIAMPLDYPLRSKMNEAILQMQENGIITKLKNKWWKEMRDEEICSTENDEESEQEALKLSLRELAGIFVVSGIGIGLAYVVGICEFLWNVRNVSVDEHITYWQALKIELLFAINFWVTRKRVKPKISQASSSSSSSSHSEGDHRSRSIARSLLQGAGSLFQLNRSKSKSPSRNSGC